MIEPLRNLKMLFRRYTELPNYLVDRFTLVDERFASIDERFASIDERLASIDERFASIDERLASIDQCLASLNNRLHDLRSENLRGGEQLASGFARDLNSLNEALSHLSKRVAALEKRFLLQTPWKPEDRELAADPEIGLMGMLYNYVPSRIALDVGANVGRVSAALLDAGFDVYAFEPFPEAYNELVKSLGKHPRFKAFSFALGSKEGILPLHIASGSSEGSGDPSLYNTFTPHSFPEGITLDSTLEVPVKNIKGLVETSILPSDIGLLKIDTEGFDFEVVIGLGDLRPRIVVTEFWGDDFILAKDRDPTASGHPTQLLKEMRARGYWWSLILFRVNESDGLGNVVRFTCNSSETPRNSWGNVFFFREHEPFIHALRWCSLVLPGLV